MLLREIISQKLFATPAGSEFDIRNTLFFKILRANPLLARFYADLFRRHGANPSIINDLETGSPIFFSPDQSTRNPTRKPSKGSNPMAVNPNTRVCTHIKVNGIRCGSPSLRQEVFCYFHQRMIRGVRTPPKSRLHPIANFEDAEAIQASLMEVVNALVRNHIDVPRARLILRALSIAARNATKVRFDCFQSEMVKEVPEYPAAPPVTGPFAVPAAQAAALTSISKPRQNESEHDRLNKAFQPASADVQTNVHSDVQSNVHSDVQSNVHRNVRRKPPASVKATGRARAASRSRTG
jgi:hypothetical protein